MEFQPNIGYLAPSEQIVLPRDDETLRDAVLDTEQSRGLYEQDLVLWVRCAIGVDTGRGASFVTDRELLERHSEGGFAEWDPDVARAVRDYLVQKGYIGLRGTSQS